jgi:hypothetical protein
MSIDEQLERMLALWQPFQNDEHILAVADEAQGKSLACTLVALDTLACAFTSLVLRSDRLAGAGIERLKVIAANLSKRLTYLLEPISPIETDVDRCMVQMRSTPPHKLSDHVDYYELLVNRSGELSLCRYSRPTGSIERIAIPAHVTREVLVRLAGDFAAAAD